MAYTSQHGQNNAVPVYGSECVTKVELRIRCRNLLDKDITSKSDPMVAMYMKKGAQGHWTEIGRTENIKNCLNPEFTKPFVVDYRFEELQEVKFEVYDIDNTTPSLYDDDYLGGIQCTMGQLMSENPMTRLLKMRDGRNAGGGSIVIVAEEVSATTNILQLKFRGTSLDKKDFFGLSDPFLEVYKKLPIGSWQLMHRTEYINNTLNPNWRPFELSDAKLIAGNPQKEIRLVSHDHDNDGGHDYIGECITTVDKIMEASKQAE